ncbi:MAG TPA: alpha/beta fold hydrolase [Tahibacter sp.]|uniref:alpha/beta hydrolase n=1 Tax=Tahibacter sp. TaxID=2056211 RepID=UPI002BCFE7F2|nr:alpha/beta fold hydrolase [Tahibacter sp.]HSX60169.1 alpha/beta fold hydrolase [Tahibacter sp.]
MLATAGALMLSLVSQAAGDAVTLGSLTFARCELTQPRSAATTAAWCAPFSQPENRALPDGRRITFRLGLIRSDAAKVAADPLVLLAGGPGQAATESWPQVGPALALARRTRHVILLDQRGTGGSNALRCDDEADHGSDVVKAARAHGADADAARALTERCLRGIADKADATQYTTSEAVEDLEALRQALGAPKLNLVGISYGTRVAQQYARRHPDGVRSLVLDGVAPNEVVLGADFARTLDDALRARFALCDADAACSKRFGKVYDDLYALRTRLQKTPQPVSLRDPLTFAPLTHDLDADTFAGLVRLYAYAPETAALLPLAIHEAANGNAAPLMGQASLITSDLGATITSGMGLSVICAEDADLLTSRPEDRTLILGDDFTQALRAQCEAWPRGRRPDDFHEALKSDVPSLLLSGEYDPVTPPRYGDQVLKGLSRARHLVAPGQGHNVIGRGCLPRLVARFVDRLETADLDAGCIAEMGPTPFFLDYNGASP